MSAGAGQGRTWHGRDRLMAAGGLIVLVLGAGFVRSWAAETSQKKSAKASEIDEAAVREKLQKVLENQQALLQKFDALKEEVRIIKVRASSRGAITQ